MVAQSTLFIAGSIALLAGATYGHVALQLARRPGLSGDSRSAIRLFALWWGALGANLVVVALASFAATFGTLTFGWQMADSILQRGLLSLSLVGLMGYMFYVLTGHTRLLLLSIVYATYFVFLMGSLVAQQPTGVTILAWRTDLEYAREPAVWMQPVNLALTIMPPVVSSIAYLRLLSRVVDRSKRYRIAVVSSSLLVWWTIAVVAGQPGLIDSEVVQLTGRALSLCSALAVLAAFRPPLWVQRRYGIQDYASAA